MFLTKSLCALLAVAATVFCSCNRHGLEALRGQGNKGAVTLAEKADRHRNPADLYSLTPPERSQEFITSAAVQATPVQGPSAEANATDYAPNETVTASVSNSRATLHRVFYRKEAAFTSSGKAVNTGGTVLRFSKPKPISNVHNVAPKRKHDQVTAAGLCLFLGYLGVHRFYLSYKWQAWVQLFTLGGLGVWWLIDLVRICTGNLHPYNNPYSTTFN